MLTRGAPIAQRLANLISEIEGSAVETAEIDIIVPRRPAPASGGQRRQPGR
jgi:pyrimidine operon attenuation protein/uracil phosphoribosyltransferase